MNKNLMMIIGFIIIAVVLAGCTSTQNPAATGPSISAITGSDTAVSGPGQDFDLIGSEDLTQAP